MRKSIWISYDLGVQGDYDHFYAWLDNHKAVECGNSIAYVVYEVPDETLDKDFMDIIKADMEKTITFSPGNRIYIIRYVKEGKYNSYYGQFLIGKRKASPWEGYGDKTEPVIDGNQ